MPLEELKEFSAETIAIDANVGGNGIFAAAEEKDDYMEWLEFQYKESQIKEGTATIYYGLSQRTHQIVYRGKRGATVQVFGQHAAQVAYFIEKMGGNSFSVSVANEQEVTA